MIAALVCALVAAKPMVVELPDPSAASIDVQVLVRLPELDARELGETRILAGMLLAGTTEITDDQLRLWSSSAGQSIRCAVMPDHLQIGFSVRKGELSTAGLMVESLCRRATLAEDAFSPLLDGMSFRVYSYWSEALDPRVARYDRIKAADIGALYAHLFRPQNIVIAVGGAFEAGAGIKEFADRFEDWIPERDDYPRFHFVDLPKLMETRKRPITTVELSCPECALNSPGFAAHMAAVVALGVGKGSAVFRVAREAMGLSYKQDAFLWPSPLGLRARIIVTFSARRDEAGIAERLSDGLLKEVAGWQVADLERARAMLRASMVDGIVPGPICLRMDGPLGASLPDRTLLAGYWALKSGTPYDQGKLFGAIDAVTLDELKATATELISKAKPFVIGGR